MTRNTFFKFLAILLNNLRKLLTVNLLILAPTAVLAFTLIRLLPALVSYVDTLNVSVSDVHAGAGRGNLVLVFIWGSEEGGPWKEDKVYVFQRRVFNSLRKHIFMSMYSERSLELLEENAISTGTVGVFGEPIPLSSKNGYPLLTLEVKNMQQGGVEVLFYRQPKPVPRVEMVLYVILMTLSFLLLGGTLGGIADFTQRVVFHEMKEFSFLFLSIRRNFFRSVTIAVIVALVLGAVAANIYFYIFMLNNDASVFIAALNFWMLVFFSIALFWAYPLMILNRDESLFKVVKKSLFISFDNLEFTGRTLLLLLVMGLISLFTLSLFPGVSGGFSFLNSALKDLSTRYTKTDTT